MQVKQGLTDFPEIIALRTNRLKEEDALESHGKRIYESYARQVLREEQSGKQRMWNRVDDESVFVLHY